MSESDKFLKKLTDQLSQSNNRKTTSPRTPSLQEGEQFDDFVDKSLFDAKHGTKKSSSLLKFFGIGKTSQDKINDEVIASNIDIAAKATAAKAEVKFSGIKVGKDVAINKVRKTGESWMADDNIAHEEIMGQKRAIILKKLQDQLKKIEEDHEDDIHLRDALMEAAHQTAQRQLAQL